MDAKEELTRLKSKIVHSFYLAFVFHQGRYEKKCRFIVVKKERDNVPLLMFSQRNSSLL